MPSFPLSKVIQQQSVDLRAEKKFYNWILRLSMRTLIIVGRANFFGSCHPSPATLNVCLSLYVWAWMCVCVLVGKLDHLRTWWRLTEEEAGADGETEKRACLRHVVYVLQKYSHSQSVRESRTTVRHQEPELWHTEVGSEEQRLRCRKIRAYNSFFHKTFLLLICYLTKSFIVFVGYLYQFYFNSQLVLVLVVVVIAISIRIRTVMQSS